MLVFWIELGLRPGCVVSSGGPGPEGRQLVGIASWAGLLDRIPLCTLTSGIRAYGRKNLENLRGHIVWFSPTSEPEGVPNQLKSLGLGSC